MLKRIKQSIGNWFFSTLISISFHFHSSPLNSSHLGIFSAQQSMFCANFRIAIEWNVPVDESEIFRNDRRNVQKWKSSSIQQITEIFTRMKCPPKTAQREHAENATIELSNCHVIIEELNEFYVNSIIVIQLPSPPRTHTINNRQYFQFAYWKARNEKATKIKFIYLFCRISVLCVSTFHYTGSDTTEEWCEKSFRIFRALWLSHVEDTL